jgi:dipeptidyl aminopeptidase/acylaminoacyl peptidase
LRTFADPVTGVTVHQITDCPEGAKHLYFTRRCWTSDGRYFLFVQVKDETVNYWVAGLDGAARQVTHFPPKRYPSRFTQHMHRIFYSWEVDQMFLILPAIHPRLPLLVFARAASLHLVHIDTGETEVIYTFPEGESEMPRTGLHAVFTADGRDLILTANRHTRPGETRIDPPDMPWDFTLRDESGIVGKVWRYDFEARRMVGCIFESNGEQSHLLTCPWDAERVLWVNYLHKRFYTMNRDGSGLRSFLGDTVYLMGHYNWDTANRRLTTLLSEPKEAWRTRVGSLDIDSGDLRLFRSVLGPGQWHQNASPDGRWIVMDGGGKVGDKAGIVLLDQQKDELCPLCQATWGLPITDEQGRAVKSEFMQHPNPSWSPDGRYVVFSSDYGAGIAQVYMADVTTLRR